MPGAVRLSDTSTGHGCYPPKNNISASSDVIINSLGAHRVGDSWLPHGCGVCIPHGSVQASGSPDVIVNGSAAARVGDSISCGDTNASGSPDVLIN